MPVHQVNSIQDQIDHSREAWDANAGMKSAFFTADWQFQSPIERERAGGEDLER